MKTHEVLLDAYFFARREADQNLERCRIVNEKCNEYLDDIIALEAERNRLRQELIESNQLCAKLREQLKSELQR